MMLKKVIKENGATSDKLIPILLEYQKKKGKNYITDDEMAIIAKELNIPQTRVSSVAEFYTLISTKPRGRFIIQVCEDVPCYINGSTNVVLELEKQLNIKMGETTSDLMFTLEHTSCIGCCDKSPAMRVGDEVYGNLTFEKIARILLEYTRIL